MMEKRNEVSPAPFAKFKEGLEPPLVGLLCEGQKTSFVLVHG
jgi:hypothetical protein